LFLQELKYHMDYIEIVVSKQLEISLRRLVESGGLPPEVARSVDGLGGPGGLARRLASTKQLVASARFHKALSEEIRLRILHALSLTDMCPCVLKEIAGTGDSKLSYHLKVLESEGLIDSRRIRKWRIYSITKRGRASISSQPGGSSRPR